MSKYTHNDAQPSQSTTSKVNPRRWDVNRELLEYYMKVLGLSRTIMLDGIIKARWKRGANGPDVTTLNRLFSNRYASPEVYADVINFLRERILEAHTKGIDPKDLPILLTLDQWPNNLGIAS